jgi:hypothetical protein
VKDLAGVVALALVGLWVAYLVPHKLRHRQQLVESRVDDRFSENLRVVAVSDRPGRAPRPQVAGNGADCRPAGTSGLLTPGRGALVTTSTATGGRTVDRPTAQQDRITAEVARRTAQTRAAHAASVARRGAAARRRGLLAGALVALTAAGTLGAVVLPAITWVAAVVPAVLLSAVVVLGRRAVIVGRENDAAFAAAMARATADAHAARERAARATGAHPIVARAGVTGHAVRPSDDLRTQAIARVQAAGGAVDGAGWSPVPVPRPTYTLKAEAPRREPIALDNLEGSTHAAPMSAPAPVPAATPAAVTTVPAEVAPPAVTGSIDLDAVLAKRRASGQ